MNYDIIEAEAIATGTATRTAGGVEFRVDSVSHGGWRGRKSHHYINGNKVNAGAFKAALKRT